MVKLVLERLEREVVETTQDPSPLNATTDMTTTTNNKKTHHHHHNNNNNNESPTFGASGSRHLAARFCGDDDSEDENEFAALWPNDDNTTKDDQVHRLLRGNAALRNLLYTDTDGFFEEKITVEQRGYGADDGKEACLFVHNIEKELGLKHENDGETTTTSSIGDKKEKQEEAALLKQKNKVLITGTVFDFVKEEDRQGVQRAV